MLEPAAASLQRAFRLLSALAQKALWYPSSLYFFHGLSVIISLPVRILAGNYNGMHFQGSYFMTRKIQFWFFRWVSASGKLASKARQEGKGLLAGRKEMEGRGRRTFLESWLTFRTRGMEGPSSKVEKVGDSKAESGKKEKEKKENPPGRTEGTQEREGSKGGKGQPPN